MWNMKDVDQDYVVFVIVIAGLKASKMKQNELRFIVKRNVLKMFLVVVAGCFLVVFDLGASI